MFILDLDKINRKKMNMLLHSCTAETTKLKYLDALERSIASGLRNKHHYSLEHVGHERIKKKIKYYT